MLKNYIKVAFRNLIKNKTFFFINVFGLGIAIACAIVAFLNYDYNQKFDVEHKNAEHIYRINVQRDYNGHSTHYGLSPRGMGTVIRENYPDPEKIARYTPRNADVKINDDLFASNITFVDPSFFKIFDFPLISGSYNLEDPSKIYIHEELAKKYYGNEDPIGKSFTHVLDSGLREYVIGGVFKKKPANSSFMYIRAFSSYDNFNSSYRDEDETDWSSWAVAFFLIKDNDEVQRIEKSLQQYIPLQNKAREDFQVKRFYLAPLKGMARHDQIENVASWLMTGLPPSAETAPLVMATLLLLLACFNFTNTSIAISGKRLKEIGLRKVMGGIRKQIVIQFLSENVILTLLALIVGLLFAEFLVPAYSEMWEFLDISMNYADNAGLILFIGSLLIITALLAGSYPAFYISKFQPASILKRTDNFGGTGMLSRILLVLQFTISILAIISSVAFIKNAEFQREFDLGFDGEGVIHAAFENAGDYELYKNSMAGNPEILEMSGSKHQFLESYIDDPVRFEETEFESNILEVDENFIHTMGIDLLKGENFTENSRSDMEQSILVSEKFVKEMGIDEVIGKRIVWRDTVHFYIKGVIEDLYTSALWDELDPVILRMADKKDYRFLTVRTDPVSVEDMHESMEAEWKKLFPDKLYTGEDFNKEMAGAITVNNNIVNMFLFLGIIAALLAFSGLYTLVSLNIIRRMKEIAVRKILGASVWTVIYKLNLPFIIILLISCLLGSAFSYFLINMLFSSIWAYYMNMGAGIFIVSSLLMIIISALTVGIKVYRAANTNPALTLRNE